jgi:alpha-methylacyl-CoA racemase
VVALAINVPGPLATARLARLGARVIKVEPEDGDPLARAAPAWYGKLVADVEVTRLNLRADAGRHELHDMLRRAKLLLTSMRPSALEDLGLGWSRLHVDHPQLCHVAIIGEQTPNQNRAGHDLTYQARAGLLTPPHMPRTLLADLFAAERAVSTAMTLLYEHQATGIAAYSEVVIADAAALLADPIRYGLCGEGGILSGAAANYRIYRALDGWIALAALETKFQDRLRDALHLKYLDGQNLQQTFYGHTCEYWEDFAIRHDLPISTVAAI